MRSGSLLVFASLLVTAAGAAPPPPTPPPAPRPDPREGSVDGKVGLLISAVLADAPKQVVDPTA